MKVIITYTFCSDNFWKSIIMALGKPGKLGKFFLLLSTLTKERQAWCYLQVKLCDPRVSALSVSQ